MILEILLFGYHSELLRHIKSIQWRTSQEKINELVSITIIINIIIIIIIIIIIVIIIIIIIIIIFYYY